MRCNGVQTDESTHGNSIHIFLIDHPPWFRLFHPAHLNSCRETGNYVMAPKGLRGRLDSSAEYNGIFSTLGSSIHGPSTRDMICGCASPGYQIAMVRRDFLNSSYSTRISRTIAGDGNELDRQMLLMRCISALKQLCINPQNRNHRSNRPLHGDLELIFASQSAWKLSSGFTICQTDLFPAHFG